MIARECFDTWYARLFLHLCGIVGFMTLPIALPISVGLIIWARCEYGKYCSDALWHLLCADVRFLFTHDINRFCDDFDVYEEKMSRALNL